MRGLQILIVALIAVNVVAFAAYGIDKYKAKKHKWRIPEAMLLLLAFFGGALGAKLGMSVFHHKTHHKKFVILVPLFLVLQCGIAAYFLIQGL